MDKKIYIIGAGTYGEVMFELAETVGYGIEGFYDEDEGKFKMTLMGKSILGKFSELSENDIKGNNYIIAIGNNEIRSSLMTKINNYGGNTPTLIHPDATISPSAEIGECVYIQAKAYIWTKVRIGDGCIISPNVVIAHHSTIGRACLISTLTSVGASIYIGNKVFIGMGATIVTGIKEIGKNSIIGAGAVVLKDVEKNSVYVGVPARRVK